MDVSLVTLPPELIEPIARHLDGKALVSIRLTCYYLWKTSERVFAERIIENQYFMLGDSLQKLQKISNNVCFRDAVESLRIHPHSLTWNTKKPFPALAREEVDYSRWLKHPLTSIQRKNLRLRVLYQLCYTSAGADAAVLVSSISGLARLSRIEIGSWGVHLSEIERRSEIMQTFREDTNLGLLHFDWKTISEAKSRGTRATCDGDCSLTEDFRLMLLALAETQKSITELKAHYWSRLGLKCVQMEDVRLPEDTLQDLSPVFSNLRVLHLCLGFERGRKSPNELESLTQSNTWLSKLLCLMPKLEDLKLVFDGWAQWEVRPESSAPDWSGSVFHHLVRGPASFPRLRKLDLQNMFVRWQDVSRFIELHKGTLTELSLNRMSIWNVLSWTQSPPETDTASWLTRFKDLLQSMPSLQFIDLSWLCINGRMMCFYQNDFRHCSGCDDKVTSKPTDYGNETCPHYAFGVNRDVQFIWGSRARKMCGPNTRRLEDFIALSVAMIPMRTAFPLYYQADENDYAAQWLYYDGTVGRWETPGPELDSVLDSSGGYFG